MKGGKGNMIFQKKDKRTNLDRVIDSVIEKLSILDPSTEEYGVAAANLQKLHESKKIDLSRYISKDTLVIAGTNLLGIVLILGYEKADVITSKAVNFVFKGRV